jgi:hypothetical protein
MLIRHTRAEDGLPRGHDILPPVERGVARVRARDHAFGSPQLVHRLQPYGMYRRLQPEMVEAHSSPMACERGTRRQRTGTAYALRAHKGGGGCRGGGWGLAQSEESICAVARTCKSASLKER